MNIYAVYPDQSAQECCCNTIAESEAEALILTSETGMFPLSDTAYAVPVGDSFLTGGRDYA